MPAVRPPGAPVSRPLRSSRSHRARHARPPSTSAHPARPATSASSAAQTATPSPVGSVPAAPARTATSRSPSATSSALATEVARTDPHTQCGRTLSSLRSPAAPSFLRLGSKRQATNRPTLNLGGRNDSGGGPLPSIKVGHSGLTNTTGHRRCKAGCNGDQRRPRRRDASSKLPMVRRRTHVRTVVSKEQAHARLRAWSKRTRTVRVDEFLGVHPCTHRHPADSADLPAAPNGESERGNPRWCSHRRSIR
jgi:hypothetical protein